MYRIRRAVSILIVALAVPSVGFAQERDAKVAKDANDTNGATDSRVAQAPSVGDLASVVRDHGAKVDADKAVVRHALTRPEVRGVAQKVGIDVDHIAATIDTMAPSDIAKAAEAAQQVDQHLDSHKSEHDLVGGGSEGGISRTTLIIIPLLVVLLIVAVR